MDIFPLSDFFTRMKKLLLLFIYLLLFKALPALGQATPSYDTLIQFSPALSFHFQYIPSGTFIMGSPAEEAMRGKDEGPQHEVAITKGLYLGTYEVTQAQWEQVMGENPAVFQSLEKSSRHPVEFVSWNDCQEFISQLNAMGKGTFRLPTEAEWEYACRAGTQSPYYWGDKMKQNGSSDYAWANSRSFAQTHTVGSKQPNAWGLYDMSGNVWEWCQDWFDSYPSESQTNPRGPEEGKMKVFRGGSWYDFYESHRSANRHKHAPDEQYAAIGLRLVWEAE